MDDYKELLAFKKAYHLAMEIFEISKTFPKEEQYSLTDRSVGLRGLFARILERLIEEDAILHTFFLNFLMQNQKILKQKSGWIFQKTVAI